MFLLLYSYNKNKFLCKMCCSTFFNGLPADFCVYMVISFLGYIFYCFKRFLNVLKMQINFKNTKTQTLYHIKWYFDEIRKELLVFFGIGYNNAVRQAIRNYLIWYLFLNTFYVIFQTKLMQDTLRRKRLRSS